MILGVGLGAPIEHEYGRFGEPTDAKILAGLLDEGLQAITLLWSGEPVTFHGRYVTIDDVIMLPTPVQRPRVPIWVGGEWPKKAPARRAAQWDGAVFTTTGPWEQPPAAGVVSEMHRYIHARRAEAGMEAAPFDLVVGGSTPAKPADARDSWDRLPMPAPRGGTSASASKPWANSTRYGNELSMAHPCSTVDVRPGVDAA